jgi:peptidyl-tRNA hydrolase, PTH1 family
MYLIAGLGNPGDQYKNTRHNIGFLVIQKITRNLVTTNINNPNFQAKVQKYFSNLYVQPQTFMNASGVAIVSIVKYYNIINENIIVIYDDLDLPFGTIKFKIDGGHGGHNGLRSIDSHIGRDYIRIRIGIGKPNVKEDVSNYVLSDFSKEEFLQLNQIINHVIQAIEALKILSLEEVKSKFTIKAKK